MNRDKIYRIIDVNLNRAAEGLRVLEDAVRFAINDTILTCELKNLRHALLREIRTLPEGEKLIFFRDSEYDVGTKLKEDSRDSIQDLITANFRRVQEAERSLEEYGKLIFPGWGEKFRKFRFQTYTLEKKIKTRLRKRWNFSLYAITESSLDERKLLEKVTKAIEGGVTVLQLREKNISSKEFLRRALKVREIVPPHVLFLINDRVDIALSCRADGVHLGQDDLPVSFARNIMGEDKIIGVSTHNLKEAKEAQSQGADYIGVGPIFATFTKPDARAPVGVEVISQIKEEIKIPVIAVGGITSQNIHQVLKAGADGVAVISAIFAQENILKATKTLREIIDEFRKDTNNMYKK